MKLSQLKSIVKEAVKEAIQEEMKDVLLEAVRSPKQTVYENRMGTPTTDVAAPSPTNPVASKTKEELREAYQNILGNNGATFNTSKVQQPLQIRSTDTASPNGQLPEGDVPMDMIANLLNK